MKRTSPLFILAAAALLLLSLAACASLNPPPLATPTPQASPTPEASPLPSVPPTAEPYLLEGATTTESGLQFLEQTPGQGPNPQPGDLVTLHFTGTLPDGTEFGSTKQTGDPVTLVFGQDTVLPGLDEGIALMTAGSTAKMVLPSELAFGETGYGMVPPNSQVIMDVELFSIAAPPEPPTVEASALTTTESGLQYADLATGDGETAKLEDILTTHYTLWVRAEEGDQYIASSNGREPLTFVQGAGDTVFPGWEEGVLGMQVGGKRLLVIPPELGLGETGGQNVPPNATLVMEIELVDLREQPTLSKIPDSEFTTTESGLSYYDILTGEGPAVQENQTVSVHYSGWLEDGTLFDSSVTRNEPFTLTLGQGSVIQGWEEGLLGMQVGGKRQLIVPAALGYGESGAGGVIPPNATLIFEIELLEIQP